MWNIVTAAANCRPNTFEQKQYLVNCQVALLNFVIHTVYLSTKADYKEIVHLAKTTNNLKGKTWSLSYKLFGCTNNISWD